MLKYLLFPDLDFQSVLEVIIYTARLAQDTIRLSQSISLSTLTYHHIQHSYTRDCAGIQAKNVGR